MFDYETSTFLLAGPVKMHPRVIKSMLIPSINHRGDFFKEVIKETEELFKYFFQTDGKVAIITGSGTAGVESAISSLVKDNDTVLSLTNGNFGERMATVSSLYSKNVIKQSVEWGKPIDLEMMEKTITEKNVNIVTVCHNETSSGIANPLKEIMKIAKKYGCYTVVDGITSVGGIEILPDEWGIDLTIVGSQKCLAAPPGIAAVAVSKNIENKLNERNIYLSLKKYLKSIEGNDTPWTPSVPLFFAVREALRMVKEEGIEQRIKRTAMLASATRDAVKEWNLEILPPLEYASNTVTAIKYPASVDDKWFRETLLNKYNVVVSGGQGPLKGKIFRIGHMGITGWQDIEAGLAAIEGCLGL
ncbi:MAG: alanine--glyoxylate aminotransferase family protein [Candidatus Thermoplasmatota archaeon]|nr:alanine--glyoxylate aminotransferase family protein [Candidatus Thermoplasmatota archaeon]MCL5963901.1 alanine--glyoxylate aminotransferase family protein [Candidatus Thermoplasmatota archaeon]